MACHLSHLLVQQQNRHCKQSVQHFRWTPRSSEIALLQKQPLSVFWKFCSLVSFTIDIKMFLLYPTCLFLALRFSHLQPVITNVVNNLAVPKENTVTSENLDVDIAAKNCTEIPGGGRGGTPSFKWRRWWNGGKEQVWFYFTHRTTRPGYVGTTTNLQIVLNTQKNPYSNQATQKITWQIFLPPPKKNRIEKFQTPKNPSIIPVTWNPDPQNICI